jgi:tetratricopeptide (TPR) repeat protein
MNSVEDPKRPEADDIHTGDIKDSQGIAMGDGAQANVIEGDLVRGDKVLGDKVLHDKIVIERVERLELTGAPQRPPAPVRTRIPEPRAARLVGREDELRWVCERLKTGDVAAIAGVRGIGGIGKTELAIAVARELEAFFEGRVIWLDCGPNDAHAIQERMAAALGVALDSEDLQVRADALALALRGQPPTLVVLDDLRRRHLADFSAIAPPRPPCALLVTSRRYDLPLSSGAIRPLDVLSPVQSRELLASLIPAAWLEIEPEAAEDIVELLERIPLALTLAARRAERIAARRDEGARHPLATLLGELRARRIQVLNQGEDPDRPDLSVVITFDASYDDLDADDQARLRKLGVFARNEFELPALQAAWEDEESSARRALERLANAGLVEETGQETWWMHDLLREYAAERLARIDASEEQATRLAHAAHWRRYLDGLELRSVGAWRDMEVHRSEVERAAEWLLADWDRASDLATELAIAISQAFQPYTFPQWEMWLTSGLAAAKASNQLNSARRLLRSLGEYYWGRGEMVRGEQALRASLTTAQELLEAATTDDETEAGQRGIAVTQSSLADLLRTRGQYDEAERLYRESLKVKEALGDSREVAVTQSSLADLLRTRGQYDEAERLYRESLKVFEALGDSRSVAVTQWGLGNLLAGQGQREEAKQLYTAGLVTSRAIRDPQGVAVFLLGLGRLALSHGQPDQGLPQLQEARRIFEALGLAHWVAHVDELLAQVQQRTLTIDDLIAMVRAARQGDRQAGQQARQICLGLAQSSDASQSAMGRGLQRVLAGDAPETALAALPEDLRTRILEALYAGT